MDKEGSRLPRDEQIASEALRRFEAEELIFGCLASGSLNMVKGMRYLPHVVTIQATALLLSLSIWVSAPAAWGGILDTSEDYWALLAGYGQSFPGWGLTEERVHSLDVVPRYSHLTIDDIGSGWYAGRHDTFVELPLHLVDGPGIDTSAMVGINLLAAYTFTSPTTWQPYVFGGGGILYSFADIPGMGADWNGNYQFAGGLRHELDSLHAILIEIRYHHISNAGTEDPNVPLNSIKLMLGYTF